MSIVEFLLDASTPFVLLLIFLMLDDRLTAIMNALYGDVDE